MESAGRCMGALFSGKSRPRHRKIALDQGRPPTRRARRMPTARSSLLPLLWERNGSFRECRSASGRICKEASGKGHPGNRPHPPTQQRGHIIDRRMVRERAPGNIAGPPHQRRIGQVRGPLVLRHRDRRRIADMGSPVPVDIMQPARMAVDQRQAATARRYRCSSRTAGSPRRERGSQRLVPDPRRPEGNELDRPVAIREAVRQGRQRGARLCPVSSRALRASCRAGSPGSAPGPRRATPRNRYAPAPACPNSPGRSSHRSSRRETNPPACREGDDRPTIVMDRGKSPSR